MRHSFLILFFICSIILITPLQSDAQVMPTLYHANHIGYRLPGTFPTEKFVITLPGFGMGIYNSGFSYNDLVVSSNNSIYTLDVPGVLGKLESENTLRIDGALQTLGAGWKMKNLWLEVGHQVRFENYFYYPKDVFGVFFQGNAAYIGKTADLGVRVNSFNYSEIYAGIAWEMGNVSLGGRIKWLNGATSARTERNKLDLYTSNDIYQLTLTSDYLLYTSPELEILKGEGTDFQMGVEDYDFSKFISRNNGFALDLGGSVKFGEKLRIDAAIMDLGSITWKDDIVGYESKKTVQYDGFEFNSLFSEDSLSIVGALDTLEELLGFEEVAGLKYKTALPWHFQVGARYEINRFINVSGLLFGQKRDEKLFTGFSMGLNFKPLRFLEAGISYTLYDKSYGNIGLHTLFRLGPVRIYLASDNIISMFIPNDSRLANGRAGLQLAF